MTKLSIQILPIVALLLSLCVNAAPAQPVLKSEKDAIAELAKAGVEVRKYYLDDLHKYVTEDDKTLKEIIGALNDKTLDDLIKLLPKGSRLFRALNGKKLQDCLNVLYSKTAYFPWGISAIKSCTPRHRNSRKSNI